MSQVGDMFLWGCALGLGAGGVLGYGIRSVVAWSQSHKREVDQLNTYKPYSAKAEQRRAPLSVPTFVSLPAHKQEQPIPKLREVDNVGHHPDRGVVLDALTSAGYKKAQATNAVDACTGPEKATVESWTVAALRRAAGK